MRDYPDYQDRVDEIEAQAMREAKQFNGRYYAKDGVVWKAPIAHRNVGSTSISIGFPVCKMHDAVGPEAAEAVAALMNLGLENSVEMSS
jgi:hypothetical protein